MYAGCFTQYDAPGNKKHPNYAFFWSQLFTVFFLIGPAGCE